MRDYTCAKCSHKFSLMSWENIRACPECQTVLPDENACPPVQEANNLQRPEGPAPYQQALGKNQGIDTYPPGLPAGAFVGVDLAVGESQTAISVATGQIPVLLPDEGGYYVISGVRRHYQEPVAIEYLAALPEEMFAKQPHYVRRDVKVLTVRVDRLMREHHAAEQAGVPCGRVNTADLRAAAGLPAPENPDDPIPRLHTLQDCRAALENLQHIGYQIDFDDLKRMHRLSLEGRRDWYRYIKKNHRREHSDPLNPPLVKCMLPIELATANPTGQNPQYELIASYTKLSVDTVVKCDGYGCIVPITGEGTEYIVGKVASHDKIALCGKGTFIPMRPGEAQKLLDRLAGGEIFTMPRGVRIKKQTGHIIPKPLDSRELEAANMVGKEQTSALLATKAMEEAVVELMGEDGVEEMKDVEILAKEVNLPSMPQSIPVLLPPDPDRDRAELEQPITVGNCNNFRLVDGKTVCDMFIKKAYKTTATRRSSEVWIDPANGAERVQSLTLLGPLPTPPEITEAGVQKVCSDILNAHPPRRFLGGVRPTPKFPWITGSNTPEPPRTKNIADEIRETGLYKGHPVVPQNEDMGVWLRYKKLGGTLPIPAQVLAEIRQAGEHRSRLRRFPVAYQRILEAIVHPSYMAKQGKVLVVNFGQHIPDDVEIVSVHEDFHNRSFTFTLWHWSFEPVAECVEIPRIDGQAQFEIVDIAKQERERIVNMIVEKYSSERSEIDASISDVVKLIQGLM